MLVGVGGGAGGLEACAAMIARLPRAVRMSIVVILQADERDDAACLATLQRAAHLPVVEATAGQAIRPGHVHLVPRGECLTIDGCTFRDAPPGVISPGVVTPVLRALAHGAPARAVGVILSGSGTDGTAGLCDLKAAGALTFAQDEASAKCPEMPRAAANGGCVDFVLPPDEIGRRLAELDAHPHLLPAHEGADTEALYRRILATVRAASGVDFREYRDRTIKRRIVRRLMLQRQSGLAEYAGLLERDPAEADALYRDLLINVTSFFREPELFEALKRSVFPAIVPEKPPDAPVRLWVPGCSTGQEVYSLAIALVESLDEQPMRPPIQIFATDLSDTVALARARAGVYPATIEAEVTPDRLRRFFRREGDMYVVDRSIRDLCVFAPHNVATDPPFIHVDLVSCRNVLIYMTPALQNRVLRILHYALNTPGFLVLGASEGLGPLAELFTPVERSLKVFAKKPGTARPSPSLSTDGAALLPATRAPFSSPLSEVQQETDRLLLGRFAPPAILVNEEFDVLQFRGRTGAYLEAPSGEPTANALRMARDGISIELRRALLEARSRNETIRRPGLQVAGSPGVSVDLEVVPVRAPRSGARCFLVLFHETASTAQHRIPPKGVVDTGLAVDPPAARDLSRRIRQWWARRAQGAPTPSVSGEAYAQLQQELALTREYLRSVGEQQEATNEELRSANEEVLSSNEELRSTNEELQTAKEELQSGNEELTTVNEQLQQRNLELTLVNNDLANLLTNINIPVVLISADHRIRRFTPAAARLLGLDSREKGQSLAQLRATLDVPDLEAMLTAVLESTRSREREVSDRDGHSYMLRVHPYRTADGRFDGAMVVLVDITDLRRGEEAERQLAAIVASSEDAIIGKALDGTITSWNQGAEHVYGYAASEVLGLPVSVLVPFGHEDEFPRIVVQLRQGARIDHFETVRRRKDGRLIDVSISYSPVRNAAGEIVGAAVIARDITANKIAIRDLAISEARKAAIMDTSLDAIVSMDHEGKILDFNPAAERMFGYTAAEAKGQPMAERLVPPQWREQHRQGLARYLATGETHVLGRRVELTGMRSDGSVFPIELAVTRISVEEPPVFMASVRDITERKRAEEQLRFQIAADRELAELVDYEETLQKVARLAVPSFADWCVVDMVEPDGSLRRLAVAHADPAKVALAERVEERYPESARLGRGPMRVVQTGRSEMLSDIPDEILVARARDAEHLRLLRELGLQSYLSVPLRVRERVVGVVTFIATAESGRRYYDSDRRAAEDLALRVGIAIENARLYTELKETDRRKDEFLAMLSHELRNPLAPVRSALDVLQLKGSPVPELRQAREVIDRQIRQMGRLVDDLLDLSRITRGKITLHPQTIELDEILRNAAESSRPFIEANRHELTVSRPPHRTWLHADPVRLVQVLLNLLNNAAKFTPPGGQIWLSAAHEDGDQASPGTVVFTVRDTGMGISAETLPGIFDMFAQGDRALERSQGGLGVGLTLVRALVELHGGTVEAHSGGIAKGSEFIVRLPAARPDGARGSEEETAPARDGVQARRVLVVDDNRDQAQTLGMLLSLQGHAVRIAFDGHAALDIAREFRPEVALVDIGLPGMNGYEIARRMRTLPGLEGVVLVAQTGWGQEEHRRRSREAGFDEHLVKPIGAERLRAVFERL